MKRYLKMDNYYNDMRVKIFKDEEDYFKKILKIYNKSIYNIFNKSWEPLVIPLELKSNNKPKLHTKYNTYHYDELNELQNELMDIFDLRQDITQRVQNMPQNDIKKIERRIKYITEYYARGLKQYIHEKKLIDIKISNAYLKLWELLYIIPEIIPENYNETEKLMVFQMAEAPGQFINSITRFLKINRSEKYDYDWRANSLKPENFDNLMKYGQDEVNIFGDDYGLIKNNQDKWIWGIDGTGDIINTDNIQWYREYVAEWSKKNKQNINLVTGDAGMLGSVKIMHKLELAQMVLTLATSQKGSNCVIKHFLPYIRSEKETYYSSGTFVNMVYSYLLYFDKVYLTKPVTSNPNSGEIYIVGIGFKGITDKEINNYYDMLNNYEVNHCWFNKKDLDEKIVKKILNFINIIHELNLTNNRIRTLLMLCHYKLNDNQKYHLQCSKQLSLKYHGKTRETVFNVWLKKHKFI